jgi:hypothetical protein
MWEGSEGILWLCTAPIGQLQSGQFYLDRSPQFQHMGGLGPFFNGTTENTVEEVDAMMQGLEGDCTAAAKL